VDLIIVSRHGESVEAAKGLANGDPGRDPGLTATGREQAEALGRQISGDRIDLCITSQFPRTRQTAAIALSGRDLTCEVDPDLNDIHYGELDGRPIDEYRAWAREHPLAMPIPGGESRVDVARRLCSAMEGILDRLQRCALVITHEKLIAYLLTAVQGQTPAQTHLDIPYATGYRLPSPDVREGIALLRGWIAQQEGANEG
jgi:probable phosphoglycerate mutase